MMIMDGDAVAEPDPARGRPHLHVRHPRQQRVALGLDGRGPDQLSNRLGARQDAAGTDRPPAGAAAHSARDIESRRRRFPRRTAPDLSSLRLELLGRAQPIGTQRRRLLGVRDLQRDDLHAGEGHVRAAARRARRYRRSARSCTTTTTTGRSSTSTSAPCAARRSASPGATSAGSSTSGCTPRVSWTTRVDSYGVTQDASGWHTAVGVDAARRSAASDVRRRAHVERLDDGARGCDGRCPASRDT